MLEFDPYIDEYQLKIYDNAIQNLVKIELVDIINIINELNVYIKKTSKRWNIWHKCKDHVPNYNGILTDIKKGSVKLSDYENYDYYPYLHVLFILQYPIDIDYKLSYLDKIGYYEDQCAVYTFEQEEAIAYVPGLASIYYKEAECENIKKLRWHLNNYTLPEYFHYTFIPRCINVVAKIKCYNDITGYSLCIDYQNNNLYFIINDFDGYPVDILFNEIDLLCCDLEYVKEEFPEEYTKYIKKQAQNLFI